jgi:hypothetical protein
MCLDEVVELVVFVVFVQAAVVFLELALDIVEADHVVAVDQTVLAHIVEQAMVDPDQVEADLVNVNVVYGLVCEECDVEVARAFGNIAPKKTFK